MFKTFVIAVSTTGFLVAAASSAFAVPVAVGGTDTAGAHMMGHKSMHHHMKMKHSMKMRKMM